MPKPAKTAAATRIKPIVAGATTRLSRIECDSGCGYLGDKPDTAALVAELKAKLVRLQEVLYAGQKHRILVVIQAMDTGGKDGVIRNVFSGINPHGVRVASFKAPSADELAHDYLWRVHKQTPAKGEIVVFNRSHYEDVLITRVHGWVSRSQCKLRYAHINAFERMLADEGTTILKFFLHISKDEQKQRLQDRLDDDAKAWKFNIGDLKEREHWDDYQSAYEDALRATSQTWAPWYVVPADRKWIRDLYVAQVLADTLDGLAMRYPDPPPGLAKVVIK